MGMDIIGDPTICLTGNHDVWIDTIGLPSVDMDDVVYIYWPDGTVHYGDLVNGDHFIGIVKHGSRIVVQPLFIGVGYVPLDPIEFFVVDPIRTEINYQKQCQVRIQSHGLYDAQAHTVVTYTSLGVEKTFELWDGDDFFAYCDAGTQVVVDDEVMMVPDDERYKSIDQDTWTVDDVIDAHMFFYHQYKVKVDISTIGPDKLHAGNYVECRYWLWGDEVEVHLYDDKDLNTWADHGSALFIAVESQESIPNVRWRAIEVVQQTVDGPIDVGPLLYRTILDTDTHSRSGRGGPPVDGELFHPVPVRDRDGLGRRDLARLVQRGHEGLLVVVRLRDNGREISCPASLRGGGHGASLITVVYHPEYLVTIGVEGLPDGVSTEVTVGVANVHDVDWSDFILTLYSGNANAWTGWVHPVTDLTALGAVNSGTDEKYVLFCWTGNDVVFSPPTMWAIEPNWYLQGPLHRPEEGDVQGDGRPHRAVMVHLKVSLTSAIDGGDKVILIDDLPNEFSFVVGSAKDNGREISTQCDQCHGVALSPAPHLRLRAGRP